MQPPPSLPPAPRRKPLSLMGVSLIALAACCVFSIVMSMVRSAGEAVGLLPTRTATLVVPTATIAPSATILPTDIPAPTSLPTLEPTPEPTTSIAPEVSAYITKVVVPMGEMGTALAKIAELFQEPRLADNDWRIDVAVQMGTIRGIDEQIQAITDVPPDMQTIHDKTTDATSDCSEMTKALADGLDNNNAERMQEAVTLIGTCGAKIREADALTKAYVTERQ